MAENPARQAVLYRMVTPDHVCPFGLKARDLLRRQGFDVDDRLLESREAADAFQAEHDVDTTPQVFIDGERIGGFDALRDHLGLGPEEKEGRTYQPVIAVFATAFAMAVALRFASADRLLDLALVGDFVAISMCLLAMLKLRDLVAFSNQFLTYDLLARRVVRYAYVYPFAELFAGVGMLADALDPIVGAVALFIGSVGGVSVVKAVYVDGRELECACVGGDSRVPLGFVSLTENVMMVGMGALTLLG